MFTKNLITFQLLIAKMFICFAITIFILPFERKMYSRVVYQLLTICLLINKPLFCGNI